MVEQVRKTHRKGRDVTHDPKLYSEAWDIYRRDPFENALRRGLGIARSTAKTLIETGVPELGLPPLREKMKAVLRLASQMDVEESAKSLALGRAAIRTGIGKFARAITMLEPDEIPPALIVPQLATLVTINEKLSRAERLEAEPDFTEKDIADTLSELLTVVASRRLPGGAKLLDSRVVIDLPEGAEVANVVAVCAPAEKDTNGG